MVTPSSTPRSGTSLATAVELSPEVVQAISGCTQHSFQEMINTQLSPHMKAIAVELAQING
eukprot:8314196-Prorocentrum_lima.AAC.1